MIGMIVGDDDAFYRSAAEMISEDLFPERFGRVDAVTAIDDGPAATIFQQPQIDVIQRKRQRHAQPKNAGHNLCDFARCGNVGKKISKGIRFSHDGAEIIFTKHSRFVDFSVMTIVLCRVLADRVTI